MLTKYLTAASLLLAGGLAATPARAQTTLQQVRLNGTGELTLLPGGCSLVHYFVEPVAGPSAVFRHVVLDSALRPRHERDLTVRGFAPELLNYSCTPRAALYQFRRRLNDTVFTAVVDTAGQVLSVRREAHRTPGRRRFQAQFATGADSVFVVAEADKHQLRLRGLDLQQRERWRFEQTARHGQIQLLNVLADQQVAWVLVADNARSRRVEHTAYCLDLASGKVLSATLLDTPPERRIACRALVLPSHALTVVGRAYHRRRISQVSSGDLFVTRLAPDGSRQLDRSSSLTPAPGLLGAGRAKTYWQDLVADPDGNLRLVGQTFTSTSLGANFAIGVATGIATLGFVRISFTTLRPREIVSFQFAPDGQLGQARVQPVPERTSYTLPGYIPGQPMAELAAQAGVFPVRALTPDGRQAVLRTSKQLLLLDLDTQQRRTLREGLGNDEVWGVRGSNVLLYRASRRSQHQVGLERLTYK